MKTLLVIFMLALFASCDRNEIVLPTEYGYQFSCVPDSIPTDRVCYFQVSFGDTTDGLSLVDIDTTLIIGATASVPRDINSLLDLSGKYCQMFCFYIDCSYQYISCCFFATKQGVCMYESCTPGVSRAFLITE